jgi:hypothetical protein
MVRILHLLPVLALSIPASAQAPAKPEAVPAQALSANQGINPDDLITARAVPYVTTLVRDPFAAPTDAEQTSKGDLVDDIGVKGRVVSNGKVMAVVTDARGNVRTLPVGFKFRDGELVAISDKAITFHQWDISGTNTKIYRTVVKTFKREEGKR